MDLFEEPRNTKHGGHGINAMYRFRSQIKNLRHRLKIEINCKEHKSVYLLINFPYEVNSEWYSGICNIHTYDIHKLLGTKLRALYQRKKGRDLFDLDYTRLNLDIDWSKVVECFKKYISETIGKRPPSQKEFIITMNSKIGHLDFDGDMEAILRPGVEYNQEEAWEWIQEEITPKV